MIIEKNKTCGFTLIELLVVVAIISLLSSIVLSALTSARAKARNTQRLAGVTALVNAFNLGISYSNPLPVTESVFSSPWVCISDTCYEGWSVYVSKGAVDTFLSPNLPQKPPDPVGGRGYGGILYRNPYTPLIGAHTGQTGAYVVSIFEPGFSCPRGSHHYSALSYTECAEKID